MDGSTSRIRSIDVFKGAAIIVIIFCHICFVTKSEVGSPSVIIQTLYLGLMVFLMISGYFYRPDRSFADNMKKRVSVLLVALLICCFALTAICYAWAVLWGQPIQSSDLYEGLRFMLCLHKAFDPLDTPTVWEFCGNGVGYYFLWLMLGSFVIFYALEGRVRKDIRLRIAVIAILIAASLAYRELYPYTLPFYFHLSMMGAAFMFTGSAFKQYKVFDYIDTFEWRSPRYWAPFLLSMVVSLVLVFFLPPNIKFDQMMFGDYGGYSAVPYYVEAIVASVFMMYLCVIVSKIPVLSDALMICGRHSLGLLLLHGSIVAMMVMPFYTLSREVWLPEELGVPMRVVLAFATLLVCLIICRYGPVILERLKGSTKKD
jgi:fucose 4-O-acetylase-like acetyltransferase